MAYDFSKVKVLVVEDSQPMTRITQSILESFGFRYVSLATNADVAYQRFCEEKHDLILMDWLLKPINGIDLTDKIRTDGLSPNPFVPIILMTGFSEKRRVEEARDTGVTEFMVKPFSANDLYKRIDYIITKPRQFVKSPDFFGPDRRRRVKEDDSTPKRRAADQQEEK